MHSVQKGQVALVLVLIMTVVSALAVSIASRSTVDTRIQQTESLGVQALLFAQTGLEQMIINSDETELTDPSYQTVKTSEGIENFSIEGLVAGSSREVYLTGADFVQLTGLSIYWQSGSYNSTGQPAILVSLIRSDTSISDYAYDYSGENGFTAGLDGADRNYAKKTPKIDLTSDVVKVRVTVFGEMADVLVVPLESGAVFPAQVVSIKSIGLVSDNENTVKYGLRYDESSSDTVPSVFDYVLFSSGNIVQ